MGYPILWENDLNRYIPSMAVADHFPLLGIFKVNISPPPVASALGTILPAPG